MYFKSLSSIKKPLETKVQEVSVVMNDNQRTASPAVIASLNGVRSSVVQKSFPT
jgi:hypothetical protein